VKRRSLAERLNERRDMTGGPFACWPRTHRSRMMHVPEIGRGGNYDNMTIRRVAWWVHHGSMPAPGRWVESVCGNVLCLNPHHLVQLMPEERFWLYVRKGGTDDCWPWIGPIAKSRRGYGRFKRGGRVVGSEQSHRLAWEFTHGAKPPPDLFVCHRCDNPPCCNPAHLFLGTAKENNHDMWKKGRGSRGPEHGALVRQSRAQRTPHPKGPGT
jgi:hypothetical protein